jgi:hypothetical protein
MTIQDNHQSHDYECQEQLGIAHSGFFIRLYLIFREIHEESLRWARAHNGGSTSQSANFTYPLVNIQKAIENGHL